MKKYLANSALISTLVIAGTFTAATNAAAQNRAGAVLFGALVGGAIVAGANQNNRNNQANAAANAAANAQRAENREVQTALNYFDFDAGSPDGVFGRRTRTAVSQLQSYMDFPVTGELSGFEKELLLAAYRDADAGGAAATGNLLSNPDGTRSLLTAYYENPNRGNSLGDVQVANALGNGASNDFGSGASNDFGSDNQVANADNNAQTGMLPMFVTASAQTSMDGFCSGANGDINGVQAEFCNLRAFAVNDGDRLATTVQGATRAEISQQCLGFAPSMAAYAASAGSKSSFELIDDLHDWADSTGVPAASLEGIAKVCLGVGYSSDNSEVALASLLALIGLDQPGYSELLGYHLAFGFGFEGGENKGSGAEWLDTASLSFAAGEQGLNGQDGQSRAILASSMAGQLRGIPAFGVVPVSAENTSGFFTPVTE